MGDLVAEMPEQSAVGFAHLEAPPLALGVVGLGEIDRDQAGLVTGDDHALASVTACAGMTCARSLADVRALATRVPGLDTVHWAGCDRHCGQPGDATAVVATADGRFTVGNGAARRTLSLTAAGRTA